MLFSVTYNRRPQTDDTHIQEIYRRFMAWEPPDELAVRCHYVAASGGHGLAVVECPDAGLIREATAPFSGALEFHVEPVISAPEALAISMHAVNGSDSV